MKGKGSYWLRSGAYTFLEKFLLQLFRLQFFSASQGLTRELFGIWTIFLIISAFVEAARMGLIQNACKISHLSRRYKNQRADHTQPLGAECAYYGH